MRTALSLDRNRLAIENIHLATHFAGRYRTSALFLQSTSTTSSGKRASAW